MKKTKKIREKLYKKEPKHNFLKEKKQKDGLTNEEKRKLKNIDKYLKNLKKDLEKLQKYQYNTTYGLDYLFNEKDYYYEPKEIKKAFDGSYMLYESKGDKGTKLTIYECFDKIKSYLKDTIDDHKARDEWKIQLIMKLIFVSFVDKDDTHAMHTKSDNIVIMSGTDTNDTINELFDFIS